MSRLTLLAALLVPFSTLTHEARAAWFNETSVDDLNCEYQDPTTVWTPEMAAACQREWRCVRWIGGPVSKGNGTIDELSEGSMDCDTCDQCGLPEALQHDVHCGVSGTYGYDTNIEIDASVGVEGGADWLKGQAESTFNVVDGEPITWNVFCDTDEWPPCLRGNFTVLIKVERNAPLFGRYLFNTSEKITGPDDPCRTGADGVSITNYFDHYEDGVPIGTMDRGLSARCSETIPNQDQIDQTGSNCP